MNKKLLVIGGSGLVGSTLIKYAKSDYDLHFTYNKNKINFKNISSTQLELVDKKNTIVKLISDIHPDIVVHTAAHSNVDICEADPTSADFLHVEVTKNIANICKKINSKLIYISTDYVFKGNQSKKFKESDPTNPINHYGKTKLQAEKIILDSSTKNVVLRTAVIYGWHSKSRFSNWIIESLEQGNIVRPHNDQYNTPTLVDDLIKAIFLIMENDVSGLFHAAGKTCLSRYEFAIVLAEIFGLDKKLIKPVTGFEKKQIAIRPKSPCLDSTHLESLINFKFHDLRSGLEFIYELSNHNS